MDTRFFRSDRRILAVMALAHHVDPAMTAADEARRRISKVVRMLMAARGIKGPQLAPLLHMKPSSLYGRLNGKNEWLASEIAALAVIFGEPESTFYAKPEDVVRTIGYKGEPAGHTADLSIAPGAQRLPGFPPAPSKRRRARLAAVRSVTSN